VKTLKHCLLHALGASAIAMSSSSNAQSGGSPAAPVVEGLPNWAFVWDPNVKVPPPDDKPNSLPDSTAGYSWKQARDLFVAPDWHPSDHEPMPDIVANGRKPDVRACGSCHRAEGTGGPENANLAGLPVSYLVQQIADFKSGARKMSGPDSPAKTFMMASVKVVTEAEALVAAQYFSALKPKRNVKVVEAETIPKIGEARMFFTKSPGGGAEPLGRRIVEFPDNAEQYELRDAHSIFTAYVPVGSVAKGETLAKTGGSGTTLACGICHGPELKGVGPIPRIAGRSPTYIVRQLYEFKTGGRSAGASALMKQVVEKLSPEDIIALAAYVGSLEP
jgi:cytochrome c553